MSDASNKPKSPEDFYYSIERHESDIRELFKRVKEVEETVTTLRTKIGDRDEGLIYRVGSIEDKIDSLKDAITERIGAIEKRAYIVYGGSLVALLLFQTWLQWPHK